MPLPFRRLVVLSVVLCLCGTARAEDKSAPAKSTAAAKVDFVRDVQPLLAKHCVSCHGPKKEESGLRVDSLAGLMAGGYSGPAVVAGKSAESILLQVVRGKGDLKAMPPDGKKLTATEIDVLARWVDAGALGPKEAIAAAAGGAAKKNDHWSYQPLKKSPPPKVSDIAWVRNPIDAFVLQKIEAAKLTPSPEAEAATLIKRLYLDLTGLLPTPEETAEFVQVYSSLPRSLSPSPSRDTSSERGSEGARERIYEALVDKLLASPHYGERWGRHWLDQARYADSNGYTIDSGRTIWRYRDWVIDALNRDLPFNQFTIEQVAGDLLKDATLEQKIATGFHRNTLVNEEGGTDKEQFRVEAVVDRVSTVGTVWLGLSVGCARCHDHKYDAISQREFYQFFAFLNDCDEPTLNFPSKYQAKEEPALEAEIATFEKRLADAKEASAGRQTEWERNLREEIRKLIDANTSPEVIDVLADVMKALNTPEAERTEDQKKLLADKFYPNDVERVGLEKGLAELKKKLKQLQGKQTTTLVVAALPKPRETYIHIRGDFLRKGVTVDPGTLAVLPKFQPAAQRGTRLDLARWLVDDENPLTPRVTVNRVWQQYFGVGLVATENDFGTQGELPTHPELLDWLAGEFVAQEWSLKSLHKLIVTSATYRQASRARPELTQKDPYNKLLARQSRIRLEAETIRDVGLTASGLLSREVGGPSVYPPQPEGLYAFTQQKKFWPATTGDDRYRRGLYTYFWRSSPYPLFMTFDAPDANATCTRRNRSNTPLQALTLANDKSFVEMAGALGDRILREAPSADDGERVKYAFQLCFAREPKPLEQSRLIAFVESQRTAAAKPQANGNPSPRRGEGGSRSETGEGKPRAAATTSNEPAPTPEEVAWTALARVLLNLDEFITRE